MIYENEQESGVGLPKLREEKSNTEPGEENGKSAGKHRG
jgi:hypothetical protein